MGLDSKKPGLQFFEEGLRHFQAYEFKQAKRKFEAAAQLLPNQPEILDNLGITLQQLGEWDKALTYHRRVLKIFQKTNNESGIAKALLNIGDVYNRHGELAEALHQYKQVLTIAEKTKHLKAYASALMGIGEIQIKHGNYQAALDTLHQAADLKEEFEDSEGLVKCHVNLAITYERMGNRMEFKKVYSNSRFCGDGLYFWCHFKLIELSFN